MTRRRPRDRRSGTTGTATPRTVAHRGGPWATSGTPVRPAPRELAQRLSGTDEVLLLWHPESERVELAIRDLETGAGLSVDVAPDSAIDAFHHPYAYAPARDSGSAHDDDDTAFDG